MTTRLPSRVAVLLVLAVAMALAACGGAAEPTGATAPSPTASSQAAPSSTPTPELSGALRLYTSVTQETVDAVVDAFADVAPDVQVDVFRAPTGEITARLEAERREGGVRADVLWLTDPLSIQRYDDEGLLAAWTPERADAVPEQYRTDTYWGTRLLHMVIVAADDVSPPPAAWQDLVTLDDPRPVAVPDPSFAGSAFGALGWFATTDDYGIEWYRDLFARGAQQVQAPGEVVAGVAEGRFAAGMTLDFSARAAVADGSPITLVWPDPGAIAIFSPIAVLDGADGRPAGEAFVDFVLSRTAQRAIAETGWQPIRDDVAWDAETGPSVSPDWSDLAGRQDELLADYREATGG
jgi:iron(III) transport system substrate-binding protein